MSARLSGLVLAGLSGASIASAQGQSPATPSIVAVVEGQRGVVEPAALRARLASALGASVIPLDDVPRPERGLLAVSFTDAAHATVRYVPRVGPLDGITIGLSSRTPADTQGAWIVGPCVAIIREAEQGALASPAAHAAPEPVVATTATTTRSREPGYVDDDVLDPWPLADRRIPVAPSWPAEAEPLDVIDPWEGGPTLGAPFDPSVPLRSDDPWRTPPSPAANAPRR